MSYGGGGSGGGGAAGGGAGSSGGGSIGSQGYSNEEYPSLDTPPAGSIRFNTDSSKLEIYNGEAWWEIDATSPEQQTGGTRGIFAGGETPGEAKTDVIDFVNVDTTGNATDFGNLSSSRYGGAGVADRTRFILMGGTDSPSSPGQSNVIDGHEIASTGNFNDFADLGNRTTLAGGCGDRTRGLIMGGYGANVSGYTNAMEYVTIQHLGTGQDFGDLTQAGFNQTCSMSSPTRGFVGSGIYLNPSAYQQNAIEFVTISTLGNSADFGDVVQAGWGRTSASNAVRGIYSCGYYNPNSYWNSMDYITLSSLGNATDFGDNTLARRNVFSAVSKTRMVTAGGQTSSPTWRNEIDYVQIMSKGNAYDFGDLTAERRLAGGNSNSHGGLG